MWFSREYGTGAHFLSLHSKQRNYLGKDLNRLPIGLDTYMVPRKDLFGASCKDILARRPPLPSYVLIPPQQWSSNHSGHAAWLTISWLRFCHSLQHDPTREPALYRPWGNVRLVTPPPAPTARRIVLPQIISARRVFTGLWCYLRWVGLGFWTLQVCGLVSGLVEQVSLLPTEGEAVLFAHTSMGCQLKQSALVSSTRFGLLYCNCSSFLLSLVWL